MTQQQTIDTLVELIENCRDGEYGFKTCAEHTQSPELRVLFLNRSKECQQAATELTSHLLSIGGQPDEGGTLSGKLHRGWVAVKVGKVNVEARAPVVKSRGAEPVPSLNTCRIW